MPRALILGGTGAIGRATALRLLRNGWAVDLTGRNPANFSTDVSDLGGNFIVSERRDLRQLTKAFGTGADLLVDCVCYSAVDATQLVTFARDSASTVMISSKAVYIDERGNHSNSDEPPDFDGPILESQPTLAPGHGDFNSREGYGANKVAAEMAFLASGVGASIVRPSKIHGVGARRPREWYFVKRVLDRRPRVLLSQRGNGVDHPTAAVNVAALIEVLARKPGQRVVNCADPDAPSVGEICRTIAAHLSHEWEEVLLDAGVPEELGRSPWDSRNPIVLDTSASVELGYVPVGSYASTVAREIDWLVSVAGGGFDVKLPDGLDGAFFDTSFDYRSEDEYLNDRVRT